MAAHENTERCSAMCARRIAVQYRCRTAIIAIIKNTYAVKEPPTAPINTDLYINTLYTTFVSPFREV